MIQVKIFSNVIHKELEKDINTFINSHSLKIQEIKFSTNYIDGYYSTSYSAIIIYETI